MMPSSSPSMEATSSHKPGSSKHQTTKTKSSLASQDVVGDKSTGAAAGQESEEVEESTTFFLLAGVLASAVAAGGLMYRRRCRAANAADMPDDITIHSSDSVHNLGIGQRGPIVHIGGKYGVEFEQARKSSGDRALHEV